MCQIHDYPGVIDCEEKGVKRERKMFMVSHEHHGQNRTLLSPGSNIKGGITGKLDLYTCIHKYAHNLLHFIFVPACFSQVVISWYTV
jgi:hypothetical protein